MSQIKRNAIQDNAVNASKISDGSITNADLQNMTQGTIKGRTLTSGTGVPVDLTAAQMREIIQDTGATGGSLEDFIFGSGAGTYTNASSGAGTSFAASNSGIDYNTPGIVSAATGTTATGRGSGIANGIKLGQAATVYKANVFLVNLSTATEEFIADFGFGNVGATSTLPTEGIYFKYDRLTSVNWIAVNSNDTGGTTTTDTGVAAVASAWVAFSWSLNSANDQVLFYIAGTLVATHAVSANIPTGGPTVTPYVRIVKSAGTTSRAFNCDYVNWIQTFNTPRG